jgi:heptosyltransferase-2
MKTEKILVRGVNWLGDAVMSSPALLRLREARPFDHLVLLTPAKLADLWTGHPALDGVLAFAHGESVFSVARRLRSHRFDIALILPNSPRSALEAFLGRIPRRVGYARRWRKAFLTELVAPRAGEVLMHRRSAREVSQLIATPPTPSVLPPEAHHLHQYLRLAMALGAQAEAIAPLIAVTREELRQIGKRFGFPLERRQRPRLFGLNAGAAYGPAKCWPLDRFIAAARTLQERTGCHWWIFGGPADTPQANAILRELRAAHYEPPESVQSLAGQTSLREAAAALQACDVVLTNDSGPMHQAAAVGTPVVALFGSTAPELTGPGLPGDPRHILLRTETPCAPCFRRKCPVDFRCLAGISVARVVQAVLDLAKQREHEGAQHPRHR